MLKLVISYPSKDEERLIMRENIAKEFPAANTILSTDDILRSRETVKEVYMDEKIEQYILDIVFATRFPADYNLANYENMISYGASPRASINIARAAKAYAFIKHRGFVIPEDIRAICHDVLRHRICLTYEAEAENITTEDIITDILNNIEVP
jgi:MoxR-like ATPase